MDTFYNPRHRRESLHHNLPMRLFSETQLVGSGLLVQRAPLLVSAVLAGLLGWSVMAWVLKWPQASSAPLVAPTASVVTFDTALVARALGETQAVEAAPVNAVLVLSGVVVAQQDAQGVAVISVNGQAPKPVRVGQAVNADWRLASVGPREAVVVSAQGARMTLTLPVPAK
jgi:general secretion pathway protein C